MKFCFTYQIPRFFLSTIISIVIISCNTTPKPKLNDTQLTYYYDLDSILKAKKLTILMEYSSTGYFIYKGVPMGFEYDILNDYCKHLNVSMNVILIRSFATVFNELNNGEGDLIAANLTIKRPNKKSSIYHTTHFHSSSFSTTKTYKKRFYSVYSYTFRTSS